VSVVFKDNAWHQYLDWQNVDKKTLRRINRLLDSLQRGDNASIGKIERLKGDLSGLCSARIDQCNRLVYTRSGDTITVVSCSGHYE
jgi:toxin YoeB